VTTPQGEPPLDPAVARLLARRPAAVVVEPPIWREPLRQAVILATPIVVVATMLPWLHQEGIGQEEILTGNSGYADGTLLAVVAVVLSVVVANRDVARSRTWLLRWLPAILGVLALLFVVSAIRSMENQIEIWRRFGATGVYEPGFFLFVVAGTVLGCSAIAIGLRRGLARTTDGRPNDRLRIERTSVLITALTLIGLVVGTVIGGMVALSFDLPSAAVGIPLLALSVVGAVIGAVVANRIGRLLLTP
jgi:hypothetical protein